MSKHKACPICKKPVSDQYSPFCSKRCSNVDLGHWLKGNYAIPTSKRPEAGDENEE